MTIPMNTNRHSSRPSRLSRILLGAGFAFGIGAASSSALAQGHSHAAPNGGQIQQMGAYEGELVVKGPEVILYVVDAQEKKVNVTGFSATATVLARGNEQKTVTLAPAGDNKLVGKVDFPVDGKFRATVSLKPSTGEAVRARYSVDQK